MHKGLEYTPLPLEVENASSNSLTVFPSLDFDDLYCQGSPFDDDPLSDSSQYQPCSESWDDFQSLSPFGADWEMEQEFFKSDFTEFDCKPQGPTLAELNNQRSTSPLINPEMERLHRIATRTDADDLRSTGTSSPYGEIKIRVDGPEKLERNTEKEYSSSKIENTLRYNDVYQKRFTADQKESCKNDSLLNQNTVSSTTVKQELTETIELNHCNSMKTITLLAAKANSQTTTENHQNTPSQYSETILSKVAPVKPRTRTASESTNEDEQLSAIQEESDEDMDSDDEFEDSPDKDCEIPAKQRKGRRGDTEDMIPNPRKLLEISRELNRLTKIITDLKPIHSLPMTARNKSKKEKNKLASRACRLKKKAQHESNKLKLHGLELEQKRLVCLIEQVKAEIIRDTQGYTVSGELSNKVEKLIHSSIGSQVVAGHTTAFVESVLKATASTTPGFKEVDIHLNI